MHTQIKICTFGRITSEYQLENQKEKKNICSIKKIDIIGIACYWSQQV